MNLENKEDFLLKRFNRDIEKLRDISDEQLAQLADTEYLELLVLAKKLMEANFSSTSEAMEQLKTVLINGQLLKQLEVEQDPSRELEDTELDYAAGGLTTDPENPFIDKF